MASNQLSIPPSQHQVRKNEFFSEFLIDINID